MPFIVHVTTFLQSKPVYFVFIIKQLMNKSKHFVNYFLYNIHTIDKIINYQTNQISRFFGCKYYQFKK